MAIQFQCPKCSAAIRVPDAAAGKQGACPTCKTRLLVPMPQVPPPAAGAVAPNVESAAPAAADEPAAPAVPPLDFAAAIPVPKTSIGRALKTRRRRQSRAAVVLIPISLGAALLAVVFAISTQSEPKLEGDLPGQALADDAPEPFAIVSPDDAEIPRETVRAVLDRLESQPEPLISERMRVEFRGDKRGLRVSVSPANRMELVVVAPRAHPAAARFADTHHDALDAPRRAELTPALEAFFVSYEAAMSSGSPLADLPTYRDRLGLAGLTKGLGYCTEALVGTTPYRCVFEGSDGALYFIVPAGTTTFILHGRLLADGSRPFPGRYVVSVSRPKPKPEPPPETPEPPDGEMKPESTPEMKPESKPEMKPPAKSDGT